MNLDLVVSMSAGVLHKKLNNGASSPCVAVLNYEGRDLFLKVSCERQLAICSCSEQCTGQREFYC